MKGQHRASTTGGPGLTQTAREGESEAEVSQDGAEGQERDSRQRCSACKGHKGQRQREDEVVVAAESTKGAT